MHYERRVFDRYLAVSEEKQLFRTIKQFGDVHARRDHAWMRLLRQTGIRVGALHGLSVHDAELAIKDGYLRIRSSINKGGRAYSVYLNKEARRALVDLLKIRREMGHPQHPDAPLVMSRKHQAMSVRSYQSRMQHWVQAAGLGIDASPHWFRHTLAKRIFSQSTAQDPRGIAQGVLGHASINSTAVYTLPDRESLARAMEEAS
ncbi:MAG: tyrosine-type recombinase/integrase [Pseudomonadota bacterium]